MGGPLICSHVSVSPVVASMVAISVDGPNLMVAHAPGLPPTPGGPAHIIGDRFVNTKTQASTSVKSGVMLASRLMWAGVAALKTASQACDGLLAPGPVGCGSTAATATSTHAAGFVPGGGGLSVRLAM